MNDNQVIQLVSFVLAITAITLICASYLVNVFRRRTMHVDVAFGGIERLINTAVGPLSHRLQGWKEYAFSVLLFNFLGGLFLFLILLFQDSLPLNPEHYPALSAGQAFAIAASFVANTNWQPADSSISVSIFSHLAGLTVQNFLSAATGLAVAFAVIRGFTYRENSHVGNFYADVVRISVYVLLPIALIAALLLVWQGVPQNFLSYVQATTLENANQLIAQGPVASQTAISIIGSNGGGYFNANTMHPFANPTPVSNFMEVIGMLLLPMSLVIAFGELVGDKRQGWALFTCMSILFAVLLSVSLYSESMSQPKLQALHINQTISDINPGGNMEGKETRFGIFDSVLRNVSATATDNGMAHSTLENHTPSALVMSALSLMIGCTLYGGVGVGLYVILTYALIAVFILSLMTGRTPEYLGKKIELTEIKYAMLALLIAPASALIFSCISRLLFHGAGEDAHSITQSVFTYVSVASSNGHEFTGFNGNTFYQNAVLGVATLISRFTMIVLVLAIAGSLAAKKIAPPTETTTSTYGVMFITLLTSFITLFGCLVYFPVFALGPLAEYFSHLAP